MGNVHPDIKPNGLNQKDLVDLLYMYLNSIETLTEQLDADGGVTDTDYEANCYTAMFDIIVENYAGSRIGATGRYIITPMGVSDAALLELLYDIFNALETLTEQLDADGGVTDTDYEALCYTAKILKNVTNQDGNTLGNGTSYYFRPGGIMNQDHLVDLLYQLVDAWETLCEKLDADGGVTDTDYEANCFTATITKKIKNSAGDLVGN